MFSFVQKLFSKIRSFFLQRKIARAKTNAQKALSLKFSDSNQIAGNKKRHAAIGFSSAKKAFEVLKKKQSKSL